MWRNASLILFLSVGGCSQFGGCWQQAATGHSDISLVAAEEESPKCPIYVTCNGFHAGLVVLSEDVPRTIWPEADLIPEHRWIEIGWGSEVFYRAKRISASVVARAVVPNSSVLHVVGWDDSPESVFQGGDLIRLEVDEAHFAALCRHVHDSYEVDRKGDPQDLGPGIYGDSRFFRAKGKYYFPNTCNVWTAKGLKAAGLPIAPELCGAPDAVLMSIRSSGMTIRRR
jgi:uncharacterized protein (TIGR02117 family)